MNTLFKRSALALSLALLGATSAWALSIESSTVGTNAGGIKGYQPYIASIGSQVIAGGKDDGNGKVLAAVGTVIEVPTYASSETLFKFIDKDGDIPAGLGYAVLPNGSVAQKEFKIEWYEIEPTSGDWDNVSSWSDLNTKLIPTDFSPTNKNSQTLIVPESAIGKRIGFIAHPESEFGVPATGVPIKAWDLNKLWTQTAPTEPGECKEGDKDCSNSGTPDGGDNGNGGGGIVQPVDWAINIYDADNQNALIRANDALFVNHNYFATVRILDKDGKTYREPTTAELSTLKWNIVDSSDSVIASYDQADTTRVNNATGETFGPESFVKYSFKTQASNVDAKSPLDQTAPNFSEQGFGLKVTLETN